MSSGRKYRHNGFESLSGKQEIINYLTSHGKKYEVVTIFDDDYIIFDDYVIDDYDYPSVVDKAEWVIDARQLIAALMMESAVIFNATFWSKPQLLYHATRHESVGSIKRDGLKRQRVTHALNNRHLPAAVFASESPDSLGAYGEFVFVIDTDQMKKDGFMPKVAREPDVMEYDAINALARKVKIRDFDAFNRDTSDGVGDDTVIIFSDVPPKYLRLSP